MLDISFAKSALPKSGALVLLLEEAEGTATPGGDLLAAADEATGGAVSRALASAEFKGKAGSTCTILAPGAGLSRILVVGLGKIADLNARAVEEAGGHAMAALARETAVSVAAGALSA